MAQLSYNPGRPLAVSLGQPVTVRIASPGAAVARLSGIHFETDKTFVLPSAVPLMKELAGYSRSHPGRYHLVTGHTDTVGRSDYNLALSTERGNMVAAFLTQDVDAWEERFDKPEPAGQLWGIREVQHMLTALPDKAGEPKHYPGSPNGVDDETHQEAVKSFERSKGLPETGRADARNKKTRRAVSTDYLAIEGTSLRPATTMDVLGCGKRHPIDRPEQDQLDSETNRRVEVFLFEGDPVPPSDACRRGRHPGCTAYDAWKKAVTHEIEAADADVVTLVGFVHTRAGDPLPRVAVQIRLASETVAATTDDKGRLEVTVARSQATGQISYVVAGGDPGDAVVGAAFYPFPADLATDDGVDQRLHNLGFGVASDRAGAVRAFQRLQNLPDTGTVDDPTRAKLGSVHDGSDPLVPRTEPVEFPIPRSALSGGI